MGELRFVGFFCTVPLEVRQERVHSHQSFFLVVFKQTGVAGGTGTAGAGDDDVEVSVVTKPPSSGKSTTHIRA
jgi:hypothetical protein